MATSPQQSSDARRQFIWAGVVMTTVIVVLTLLFMAGSPLFRPTEDQASRVPTGTAIEQPYSGTNPTRSGDRGGAGQLAVMGVMLAIMAGGAAWIVHTSRKARRRQNLEADASTDTGAGSGSRVDELGSDHAPHDPSSPGGAKSPV